MSKLQTPQKLDKSEILKLYTSGFKPKSEHKISIEYERLPILRTSKMSADYQGELGVCNLLRKFAREENWDYITDDFNIIGLKQNHDTITLEPGAQVELSLKPEKEIAKIEAKINNFDKNIKPILNEFGIDLLNYGVSPLSTHKSINLIPKKRYDLMAKLMWGILSDVMMRETAGIQACIDFENEEDAIKKFIIANKLSPFMTAMFANSPIRGGVDTGYKSFRALAWLNTDNERCGFINNLDEDFSFAQYIENILNTPMIFISREQDYKKINGSINFNQFLQNGFADEFANIQDYELQANLCFPEVRMRNYIEMRNHDCVNNGLQYAILAIYKGILYNESAMDEIYELLKDFNHNDFCELRYNVPKMALQTKIKNHSVKDFANEILYIAEKSLISQNNNEERYLQSIKELTTQGLTPADLILRNWYGLWDKNLEKLIKYSK